jgi:hypothetical protein
LNRHSILYLFLTGFWLSTEYRARIGHQLGTQFYLE